MQLCEQYRPRVWAEVLGQEKALRAIATLRPRGLAGRCWFLSGKSGIGKTSIARLLAEEVCGYADCWLNGDAREEDAKGMTPKDLHQIERDLACYGFGPTHGRTVIINECHTLNASCFEALLTILERPKRPIPGHACWIFTTTKVGEENLFAETEDAAPWLGRATKLYLTDQGLRKVFAIRAKEIAQAEHLDGKPLAAYEELLKRCHNSLRDALQWIEQGEMLL